jgi:transposase
VGAVLDNTGRPLCCELWPGNTTDAKTLVPVVDRLKGRFGIGQMCIVADRGMISKKTIEALQAARRDTRYILGARLRAVKEIREQVVTDSGPFTEVYGPKVLSDDPSPLKVKEVRIEDRRYIVCHNEDQARKDRADRDAILLALEEQLKKGDKSLIGNKGYRKYVKRSDGRKFEIDKEKALYEARFDGTWVLRTDTSLSPAEVALKYKQLWTVEAAFRSLKSILRTRPIYHKCDDTIRGYVFYHKCDDTIRGYVFYYRCDDTIRGYVFCSFLALIMLKDLNDRLEARGWKPEWERLKADLDALEEITLVSAGKRFIVRSQTRGDAGKALQAAGMALGPTVRMAN